MNNSLVLCPDVLREVNGSAIEVSVLIIKNIQKEHCPLTGSIEAFVSVGAKVTQGLLIEHVNTIIPM